MKPSLRVAVSLWSTCLPLPKMFVCFFGKIVHFEKLLFSRYWVFESLVDIPRSKGRWKQTLKLSHSQRRRRLRSFGIAFLYDFLDSTAKKDLWWFTCFFSILCLDLAAKENSDIFYCNRIRIPDSRDWLVVVFVTVSFGSFGLILLFDCYCQKRQKQYGWPGSEGKGVSGDVPTGQM